MPRSPTLTHDPFFIFYVSRSGSTYLSRLLSQHAPVVIAPESNFVQLLLEAFGLEVFGRPAIAEARDLDKVLRIIFAEAKFHDWGLEEGSVREALGGRLPLSLADAIREICGLYVTQTGRGEERFGIKKNYIRDHAQLRAMFPNARFVIIIRDGRAVFNSKKNSPHPETGKPMDTNRYHAAKVWRDNVNLSRALKARYGEECHIVHYESLVADPDAAIRSVCDFLGLPYLVHSGERERAYQVPQRYGAIHDNIDKPPLSERVDAWRDGLTAKEIFGFEAVAGETLVSEGYPLVNPAEAFSGPLRRARTFATLAWTGLGHRLTARLGGAVPVDHYSVARARRETELD